MTSKAFEPDWISAPGATIVDLLEKRELSREAFAQCMGLSLERVDRLLSGRLSITADVAQKLQSALGGSTDFWLAREDGYRSDIARLQAEGNADAAKAWVAEMPVRDMIKFGWIKTSGADLSSTLRSCLEFFDAADVRQWRAKYADVLNAVSFRTSLSFESQPGPVLSWLRYGELCAQHITCADWNAGRFKDSLNEIRQLTRIKDPRNFLPRLKSICAASGVALVIARTPSGCHASGATRFLSAKKAMILLSFRYLSDDQFWFTFFHEAGHLLLHNKKALFIEDGDAPNDTEEAEANKFSEDMLIPADARRALLDVPLTKLAIMRLSIRLGVSRGIVVGQLQHMGRLDKSKFNWLKRRYRWSEIEAR